jgi:hypothetical protein
VLKQQQPLQQHQQLQHPTLLNPAGWTGLGSPLLVLPMHLMQI